MSTILVVAPHPDDETLGCGGTMLRHIAQGDDVHWCIVTTMQESAGYSVAQIEDREKTIQAVSAHYGFSEIHRLGFTAANLDQLPRSELVTGFSQIMSEVAPQRIYLPHPSDSHSDHRITFEAAAACTKWFRYNSIRQVFAYETLSETRFGIDPSVQAFQANHYVDITEHLEGKVTALSLYGDEFAPHPFPRSEDGVRALATIRGGEAGCIAAEAFMLLRAFEA
ncbi:MAG: PIG-L family deacetylase [Alphaproteobacteria bacterium]|jgi:N-acetylglucosamine malate deacetylase 1|nr:PIG-L family deacetylase [Alphaproteobacteria bacterium]